MAEGNRKPIARVVLGALAIPALTLAPTVLLLVSWRGELPDPLATHWATSGQPDGFSSRADVLTMLIGFGAIAVIAAPVWGALAKSSAAVRSVVPLIAGTGSFLLVFLLATVGQQWGVADAATVALPGWAFLWGAVAGVVGGLLTLLLLPHWTSEPPEGVTPAHAATLDARERPVWTRVVSTAIPGTIVAVSATLLMVVSALVTDAWWMLLVAVFLVLVMVAMLTVRVVVDASGLRVAGPFGWPRTRLGLDDIASVGTARVHALREFGGWGYRVAFAGPLSGARGFVLRSGPAIVVTRRSGAIEVVTVDDAQVGAALPEAYRRRVMPT